MEKSELYIKKSNNDVEKSVDFLISSLEQFGFVLKSKKDMANYFKEQGVDVDDEFEFYSIMICNPQKAYQSMIGDSKRTATIVLKQISIYRDMKTKEVFVSHLAFGEDLFKIVLAEDEKVQKAVPQSCDKIKELIDFVVKN